jgi:hypothetical protein
MILAFGREPLDDGQIVLEDSGVVNILVVIYCHNVRTNVALVGEVTFWFVPLS